MTENELIEKLKLLKSVEPDTNWAFSLKNEILSQKQTEIRVAYSRPKFVVPRYAMAFSILSVFAFLSGTFALAQKATPLSALYPIKKVTQQVMLSLASQEQKPGLQLSFVQEKMEYLNNSDKATDKVRLTSEIRSDLAQVSDSFKKIDKPSKILAVSKNLEAQAEKLGKSESSDTELSKDILNTSSEILAVIGQTKTLASQCPGYISNQLEELKNLVTSNTSSPIDIESTTKSLLEVKKYLETNDCLSALDSLDQIRKNVLLNSL
ncbi:MAG: hypothetical protein NTW73_02655 [Candidatus Parcubacteria bacterium]|nr:hypothetical protein [Candidatus Parcubacteria bacterium]